MALQDLPASPGGLQRVVKFVVLSVVLALPILAQAQETNQTQDQQGQQQQVNPTVKKTVKQPAPPLFRRHRRGVYKDETGLPVIDATPQSPPLEVDDPGVPDKGEYEINLTAQSDFSKSLRTFDFLDVDVNYGLLPKIFGHELPTQLKFEFPLGATRVPGNAMRVGIGTAELGLKVNFYNNEHQGIFVSLYPQIEFALPGSGAVEKLLSDPGQTFVLPLLVQKEFKYLTVVANGTLEQPIHDPARDTTGALAVGLGRAVTRRIAAMGEVRFNSSLNLRRERLVVVNFGLMCRLRDNVILYTNVGRGIFSDHAFAHTYVGLGVKFLITPKE
jgi:hypothetical protein